MTAFLDIALAFPTVIFAIATILTLVYWLFVVIGAADLEFLDGAEGVLDGIDGVFDAADGALDGAVDGAVDGVADGAADGVAEGAADGATASSVVFGPLWFLANVFRVGRIPLTISLSVFALAGFAVSFFLSWLWLGLGFAFVPYVAFATAATVVSSVLAGVATNIGVRPLEPVFKIHLARENRSLIGEVCELTTGRVTSTFGQASAHVGSDDLLIQIRCDGDNELERGQKALIISFDETRHAFVVEPIPTADAAVRHRTADTSLV